MMLLRWRGRITCHYPKVIGPKITDPRFPDMIGQIVPNLATQAFNRDHV